MDQKREKRAHFELVSVLGVSVPHLKASQGQGWLFGYTSKCPRGLECDMRYNITHMHATLCHILAIYGHFGSFLDLTRLLGRVTGSDLVLSVYNTCADMYF